MPDEDQKDDAGPVEDQSAKEPSEGQSEQSDEGTQPAESPDSAD
jgi:hypothetical protein